MKKLQLNNLILLVAILFSSSLFAQNWVKMMQDPNSNFYDVQKAFNTYYAKKEYQIEKEKKKQMKAQGANLNEEEIDVPGTEQFRRWEWFQAPRVSATGERFAPDAAWKAMEEYHKGYNIMGGAGNWTAFPAPSVSATSGAGRLNFVRRHPTNASTIYVGSPSGGLWISTDDGVTWTTNTDKLNSVIGCSDIAFDPTNPLIMYMTTGDRDAGDNYSVGLLKSTDGGTTWNTTGLSFSMGSYKTLSRVLVDPSNGNTILVATSAGIYRSTDAGVTFTQVQTGIFKDMEFKPGTPSTVYACGTEFFRSTNSGSTWTKITTGLPLASALERMAIAVSAADPTRVYLVAMKATTYDMEGFYRSIDGGSTFTKPSAPAIGNQGFYDLALAVNPSNALEVILGGQTQLLKSTDGGSTWPTNVGGVTHVDYHEVTYTSSTTLYVTSDGGVWKSTNNGGSWTNKSSGLSIGQPYGFGQSSTNANVLIMGRQDNGSDVYNGSWSQTYGNDGMLGFVSWGNDQNMWCSSQYGTFRRSIDGGATTSSATGGITEYTGLSGPGPWAAEWNEDPTTANTIYAGFNNVWKSTNGGSSWTKLGTISTSTVYVQAIAAVPTTNSQVIWAAKGGTLYKTTNGGTSWTAISGLPGGTISDIVVHNTDVNKAWVCYSGFSNVNKVFQTTNQGTSWTNISASLPNIPMNCMAFDKNSNDGIYVGTDVGVYYKDATMSVWQPFNNLLPNAVVSQIDIFYSGSKIRASLYGRGVWESTLYTPGAYPPDANFAADKVIGCPGMAVQFSDYSSGQPTSWSWTFQGGNPATSTAQNPLVAYNTPGTYSVALTATNANGTDSQSYTSYITISSSPNAAPTAAGKSYCGPSAVTLNATPSAPGTVRWWNVPAGGSPLATGNSYTTPAISGTITYYVDEGFPAGNQDVTDLVDKTMGTGSIFSANDIRGLYFDVTKPIVLNSVQVYAQSAGPRTIEILDANGNSVTDTTVNAVANPNTLQTLTINRTIYPGTNYFIKFRGTVDCWRNNSGAVYPYNSTTGDVTITNSNAGSPGYYYFFYNWTFTEIVCNTSRTAVTVTDTCTTTGMNDMFVNNHIDVYPNPNNGEFNVAFQVNLVDNYTVNITNELGQSVYEEKLDGFSGIYSKKVDISSLKKGVYMLSVSNSRNQTVKKVLVY